MKKISVIIIYWTFLAFFVFPQYNRDAFSVSKEANWQGDLPNLNSKCDIEKLLFGDFNAPVEFFYSPAWEAAGWASPTGFRIVRSSQTLSYIFEVKFISNYEEVIEEVGTSLISSMWQHWLRQGERQQRQDELCNLRRERELQLFTVETLSFSISQLFAEKLQEKIAALIGNFAFIPSFRFCDTANEWIEVRLRTLGGYFVTFRTVVDDEVWTLWITVPRSRALVFSNLFKQMIADAKAGEFDEERYMDILSAM